VIRGTSVWTPCPRSLPGRAPARSRTCTLRGYPFSYVRAALSYFEFKKNNPLSHCHRASRVYALLYVSFSEVSDVLDLWPLNWKKRCYAVNHRSFNFEGQRSWTSYPPFASNVQTLTATKPQLKIGKCSACCCPEKRVLQFFYTFLFPK